MEGIITENAWLQAYLKGEYLEKEIF